MILTDNLIAEANSKGLIKIEPFERGQLQPASYDLRVGPEAATSSHREKINLAEKGFIELAPSDFAIVVSEEKISLDNQHTARFGLRSKWARKGLVATTGAQIDPGFKGRLTVGLTNLTSKKISLSHMDDFLTVEFHRLNSPVEKTYSGPYQGKTSLDGEDIEAVLEREVMSISDITESLRSLTSNVASMEKSIDNMQKSIDTMKWYVSGTVAVGIAVIAIVATLK